MTSTGGGQREDGIEGWSRGLEAWARRRPAVHWRFDAGAQLLKERLALRAGAVDAGGMQAPVSRAAAPPVRNARCSV